MAVKGVIILHYLEKTYLGLENERRYKGRLTEGGIGGSTTVYNIMYASCLLFSPITGRRHVARLAFYEKYCL